MATCKIPVALNPVPGFCIKSRATNDTVVHATAPADSQDTQQVTASTLIPVPKGLKVFVNIAWDADVPPPPQGNEDTIQNAMKGLDIDESSPRGWFVPLVLSDARQEHDKGRCYCTPFHFPIGAGTTPYVCLVNSISAMHHSANTALDSRPARPRL